MKLAPFVLFFVCVLSPQIISAQVQIGFSFGGARYDMSNIYSRQEGEGIVSLRWGIPVKVQVGEYFRIKTGLFHSEKASELRGFEQASEIIDRKYSIKYWEVEGQLEFFANHNSLEASIFSGIIAGYAIKGRYGDQRTERNINFTQDAIRTQSIDFAVGAGLACKLTEMLKIGLDGTFRIGLTPMDASGSILEKRFQGGDLMLSSVFIF